MRESLAIHAREQPALMLGTLEKREALPTLMTSPLMVRVRSCLAVLHNQNRMVNDFRSSSWSLNPRIRLSLVASLPVQE